MERYSRCRLHINSLDILRSDVEWKSGHLAGFDASLENVQLPFQLWQQQQTTFFLSKKASPSMMTCLSTQYSVKPSTGTNPDWKFLYAMATRRYPNERDGNTKLSWTRTTYDVQGIKWITESQDENLPATRLIPWLTQLQQASIHRLNIERSPTHQLAKKPYWQVSGLHVEGHQVQLLQDRKLGLWQDRIQWPVPMMPSGLHSRCSACGWNE